ncbi:MAG: hypothetical protein EA359_18720 [Balneolaceae bacterium]|nr:MAG: hypothetical protein EA359_18720 [Balneolaceae bacterium]
MNRIVTFTAAVLFILTGLLSVMHASQVRPQNRDYVITSYGLEDGLPQSTVNSLLQSSDGYLWIGTHGGLVRFDGAAFRVFNRFNTPAIVSDFIITLYEDSNGTLWIGSEDGNLTKKTDGQFSTLQLQDYIHHWNVVSITEDIENNIWAATTGGGVVRISGNDISHYTKDHGLHHNIVSKIYSSPEGGIYVTTALGISVFNGESFDPYITGEEAEIFDIHFIYIESNGVQWIGTRGNGLYRFSGNSVENFTDKNGLLSSHISELYKDSDGAIWIATTGGISRYKDGEIFTLSQAHGLSGNNILSIIQDHEGTMWAGTRTGGLNRLVNATINVIREEGYEVINNITSISPSGDGGIWFGKNCGGVGQILNGMIIPLEIPIENTCVWSVHEDTSGRLWIGTWGGGLYRLEQGKLQNFRDTGDFPYNVILSIFEDSRGNFWFGTPFNGVIFYDNETFTRYGPEVGLPHPNARVFHESDNGDIWLGTFNGPARFRDGIFTEFHQSHQVPQVTVRTVYEDEDGIIWFGTLGSGLLRYHDDTFTIITTEQGLNDNLVFHILPDDDGYFWMGSNRGIHRVSRKALNDVSSGNAESVFTHTYGIEDGMVTRETNGGFYPSAHRSDDGRLWFPTIEGIAMIDPAAIRINETPPPVIIEEIIAGQNVISSAINPVYIQPGIRNFSLRFTALSFISPNRLEFRTMLEGFDTGWNQIGNRREEYYTNIPPGEYRFRVIASNHDGIWNTEGAAITIHVLPAYWHTGWFRLLSAIILIALFAGTIFFVSTRKLKRRLEIMEQQQMVERERLRIAQDMHDELGSRLTEIKLLGELSSRDDADHEMLRGRLREMSRASIDVIDTFREIVWSVNPQNDSLEKFIDYLTQFASEYFGRAGIRCRFDVPVEIPDHELSSDVRHHLLMAYKELCTNVVNHSGADEVLTKVRISDRRCTIFLNDNGTGFNPGQAAGKGNGLINIRKRMDSVKGEFSLKSEPGKGSTIKLEFPVS